MGSSTHELDSPLQPAASKHELVYSWHSYLIIVMINNRCTGPSARTASRWEDHQRAYSVPNLAQQEATPTETHANPAQLNANKKLSWVDLRGLQPGPACCSLCTVRVSVPGPRQLLFLGRWSASKYLITLLRQARVHHRAIATCTHAPSTLQIQFKRAVDPDGLFRLTAVLPEANLSPVHHSRRPTTATTNNNPNFTAGLNS